MSEQPNSNSFWAVPFCTNMTWQSVDVSRCQDGQAEGSITPALIQSLITQEKLAVRGEMLNKAEVTYSTASVAQINDKNRQRYSQPPIKRVIPPGSITGEMFYDLIDRVARIEAHLWPTTPEAPKDNRIVGSVTEDFDAIADRLNEIKNGS
jgi:hypothetical protein